MKKTSLFFLLAVAIAVLPGCSIVSGIFKAGMWWAFFLVFVVIALLVWIIAKTRK
jgi:hypothetical protein